MVIIVRSPVKKTLEIYLSTLYLKVHILRAVPLHSPLFKEGPIVCLSVGQFSIFLRNGSLVFSEFLNNDR